MKPIRLEELQDLTTYEKGRAEHRRRILRLKDLRRIQAGDKISLVFENRETILAQIQEMVRAERIVEEPALRHEIETYGGLLPGENELSATLFIEVVDPSRIREDLEELIGLDRGPHVCFEFGAGDRAFARFEEGHSEEGRISAVHYVRFSLRADQTARLIDLSEPLHLVVDHPNYHARTAVLEATRRSLREDLMDEVENPMPSVSKEAGES